MPNRRHRSVMVGLLRGAGAGGAAPSSVTIAMPGSDVFPFDEFHARRGLVGGHLARGWFGFTHGGTPYARSFSQGPTAALTSRADPTVHVPSLAGRSHRYVALGTSSRTPAQVVSDCITSLALDGITATDGGVDPDDSNRRLLVIDLETARARFPQTEFAVTAERVTAP